VSTACDFTLLSTCGTARRGQLTTAHGCIDTPAFMPVGTYGAVKGLSPDQLAATGTQILLANTYHLMLRPGADVVRQLGGLHRLMNWNRPILTDSGGYQVFSLAELRRLDDDGVEFRSHLDGTLVRLTPEAAISVQNQLGADIIMVLDECPPLPSERSRLAAAVQRTLAWARRSRQAHRRTDQALFGIVQGGLELDLRRSCLEQLRQIGFDGYALGGLSVGETPRELHSFLRAFAHELPAEQPRYLMGVGTPADLAHAVGAGLDLFDCVLPTRNGRKGYAFTSAGTVRLRNACHKLDDRPLDPTCDCYTCRGFERGYLRHLIMCGETLGGTLVSLHNVHYFQALMRQMREAIVNRTFEDWQRAFLAGPAAANTRDDE